MRALYGAAILVVLLLSGGCASLGEIQSDVPTSVQSCLQVFRKMDQKTKEANREDAAYARVVSYPYLRVDRYTASFKNEASQNPAAFLEKLRLLDMDARRFELTDERDLTRLESCGQELIAHELRDATRLSRLIESVKVLDDYVTAYRIFGAYALTKFPFAAGVKQLESDRLKQFSTKSIDGLEKIVYSIKKNSDPPSDTETERLLLAHAPIFVIAKTSNADVPGALEWQGAQIAANTTKPVIYTQSTSTRYGELNLRQLVYTIWFSERPAAKGSVIDLLAGKLDGLVVRVTLAPNGEALIYDSIHPCGCYHQFFPTARATPKPNPGELDEWAFVPRALPTWQPGDRLVLHIAPETHYIDQVELAPQAPKASEIFALSHIHLTPLAYDTLRALPTAEGIYRSAFDSRGFIRGSERLESWLFWPMGIANAGAMRQWGRQATAFVGRRHFDDARLMEERFEFDLR